MTQFNRFVFTCFFLLAAAIGLNAQTVHQVLPGDGSLATAIDAAVSGDIIELVESGGLYTHSAEEKLVIDKVLTIRAQEGLEQMPIVRNTNTSSSSVRLFEIRAGGSLTLQGLDLDGRLEDGGANNAKNIVRSHDVAAEADSFHFFLKVEDCRMHHTIEAPFKAHTYTIGDSIIFKNTIIDESEKEGILLRESSSGGGPTIHYFEATNCTFTKIGREAIYVEFSDPVMRINHCTFDSVSYRENKRIIYPNGVTDVEIKNSIFTNQGGTHSEAVKLYGNSTISYSDTFNVGDIATNDNATIGFGMLGQDPLYTDPANDDYTLQAGSPVLAMADDGFAMGDLRWDPNYTEATIHKIKAGENTLIDAIEAAADGDIIELISSGGVYTHSDGDKMVIDKTLTIRARDGIAQKPIIRNTYLSTSSARIFEIRKGGNLTLVGLDLDGRAENGGAAHAKNIIRGEDVNVEADSFHFNLKVEDCILHYSTEALVRAYANTMPDTVMFVDCIFDEANNEGLLLRESSSAGGPKVEYVKLENCTFTKTGREAVYIEFSDPVVEINHCTFDSISYRENKRMVYPNGVTNVTIKNSIFTNQGGTHGDAIKLFGNSTISYSDTFNTASIATNDNASVGDGMLGEDPLYFDPANNDYRLADSSPVRGQADDGRAMGDLRWEISPNKFLLTIKTKGLGLVEAEPAGPYYDSGTQVTLTAVADPGWEFNLWEGNVFPPNANPVTITMNGDETITAVFQNLTPQVTLDVDVIGLGSVEVDPLPDEDTGTYDQGQEVTLTATPEMDWEFVEWLGDVPAESTTDNPLTMALDSNMTVTASFQSVFTQFTLTVNTEGQGSVIQNPEPVIATYDTGAVVELIAVADLGWEFTGWSGDLTGTQNPDSVTMTSDKTVTASFSEIMFPGHSMEIDTTWDLWDAVEFANNNSSVDSLILVTSGGLYTSRNTSDVAVTKPLTIVAKEGLAERPVITNSDPEASNLDVFRVFDDFTIKGVIVDGGHEQSQGMKYGIRLRHYDNEDSVKVGIDITIDDCIFRNFYEQKNPASDGHALRFDREIYAGTVLITNSTFSGFGYEAIRISDTEKYDTDKALDSLIIQNCTFEKIDAEAVRYYSDVDPSTPDAPVIIEHVTINSSATRVFYLKNSGGAIVRDIIISNSVQSGHGRDDDMMEVQGEGSIAAYIDTFNVKPVEIQAPKGGIVDETTIYGIDPRYEDGANSNYTLLGTSHLYKLASDGEAIGDLRWATNEPVNKTLTILIEGSGVVNLDPQPTGKSFEPNTLVNLTAVPVDTGETVWEFAGWSGDLNSMETSDTLRMNDHKSVTATFDLVDGLDDAQLIPTAYRLEQNYPNPFNPSTTIEFDLKEAGLTTLKIYDVMGREVATLINKNMNPGYYKVIFQNPNMASGMYFYKLQSGKFTSIKKMVLVK